MCIIDQSLASMPLLTRTTSATSTCRSVDPRTRPTPEACSTQSCTYPTSIQWSRPRCCSGPRSSIPTSTRSVSSLTQGRICLDILKDKWSPALQIRAVLISIQSLLSSPNLDDPLDEEVAALYKSDEEAALAKGKLSHHSAKEWTITYANP